MPSVAYVVASMVCRYHLYYVDTSLFQTFWVTESALDNGAHVLMNVDSWLGNPRSRVSGSRHLMKMGILVEDEYRKCTCRRPSILRMGIDEELTSVRAFPAINSWLDASTSMPNTHFSLCARYACVQFTAWNSSSKIICASLCRCSNLYSGPCGASHNSL
jgi:hypothetical protein